MIDKRIPRTAIAVLCLLGAVYAATAQPPSPTGTPEPSPATTAVPTPPPGTIGPDTYPPDVNPLTGLAVDDPSALERRPIVVKVSNSPALVRPQSGIGSADLVYEHYTEAGITRFSAVFYANAPRRVGSIRSARLIDYELVPMYQGLLAFAGASIGVDKRIYGSEAVKEFLCAPREDREQCYAEADLVGPAGFVPPSEFAERAYKGVLVGPPVFYRDETIPVPHNMFVDLRELWERAAEDGFAQRPDLQGMAFHPDPPPDSSGSGLLAQVRYETTLAEWYYDRETGLYYRSTDGVRHFDAETEEQIRAANVVILYAGHYLTDIVESQWQDTVHWSKQITVWPEGDAVVLRDGRRYDVRWSRPAREELIAYYTQDGQPFLLKPGSTWVQLVQLPDQMDPEREWVDIE